MTQVLKRASIQYLASIVAHEYKTLRSTHVLKRASMQLNFSKIGSLLTLIVSRENEDTKDHKFLSKSLLIIERKAGGKRENFHIRVNHHLIYFLVPSTTPLSTANTTSQQQSYLTRLTPPATLQLPKERFPFAAVCWGLQSQRLSIT